MDLHLGRALTAIEITTLLEDARDRTRLLMEPLCEEDLRRQHDPLMSPIVWDLGHIAHFEEVWLVEKLTGRASEGEGLRGIYNPFANPRSGRGELALPSSAECWQYLDRVRQTVIESLVGLESREEDELTRDGFVYRMVLQHEYQHNETILQTLQLKKGERYAPARRRSAPGRCEAAPDPGAMVRFPGGEVTLGTHDRSAAYDNERPTYRATLAPFWIDVHPVTNGEYLAFVEAGGYGDRGVWSEQGWAWKQEAHLEAPAYWQAEEGRWAERFMDRVVALDPYRPVCHVCYWEADAYARWAGKRLPTEAEWAAAASWDPWAREKSPYPWGDAAPTAERANLDGLIFGTTPVGSYPNGVSPLGCWDMLGNVWEWTSTDFGPYPGYATFPYPEYSEVFFGGEYKVLRGGAWATRFGAIRNTFRNWDYPIRRQIFSGVRCARDD